LQQPAAIIFDLDGTLVDSAPDIRCALNTVFAEDGYPPVETKAVRIMIGGGPMVLVERALDHLSITVEPGDIDRLTASFKHTYLEQGNALTTPFPGAINCLEHLKSHGISIGLCSNKPERSCTQLLADLEVEHFFSAVQGSGSGLPMKPDPAALFAVLHRLDADPAKSLYVGDSKTDVDTARAADVSVALVNGGYTVEPAATLGADWVVESLADIPSIWRGADS
jgi:phosphoglycolate phosphatase